MVTSTNQASLDKQVDLSMGVERVEGMEVELIRAHKEMETLGLRVVGVVEVQI
jgi:hypothetical protein